MLLSLNSPHTPSYTLQPCPVPAPACVLLACADDAGERMLLLLNSELRLLVRLDIFSVSSRMMASANGGAQGVRGDEQGWEGSGE